MGVCLLELLGRRLRDVFEMLGCEECVGSRERVSV